MWSSALGRKHEEGRPAALPEHAVLLRRHGPKAAIRPDHPPSRLVRPGRCPVRNTPSDGLAKLAAQFSGTRHGHFYKDDSIRACMPARTRSPAFGLALNRIESPENLINLLAGALAAGPQRTILIRRPPRLVLGVRSSVPACADCATESCRVRRVDLKQHAAAG